MADAESGGAGPTVDERLALVDAIERREAGALRRAASMAWLSIALAAVLLSTLVFGAWWQLRRMQDDVASLEQQRTTLEREQTALIESTATQKAELARLDGELKQRQAALSTLIGAVRRTDDHARGGLETALIADPRSATLVPRAYIHIVDERDTQWARNLSDRLQNGGVIPLGPELVPAAARLRRFEVRYYKKAEEDGARRILRVLESAGVPAEPNYLGLENNRRVRPNHFEIWCPENARQFKLRPLTGS